ncbi:phage tail assembly chaperone [Methylopila sp. Yamaguchi]|uniref:phage tail assembly chaperone n=1 Tax=Methylopila sp. Yamaguchi TaxID=1437817 RepID=UPI000CB6E9BC|nr:phage tail assembly chaperone [Methylopila sp. Yamaguchi]GBD48532.1 hypothetical protein METY_1745 [Methylopila sp. Yamaguchi]
MTLAARDIVVEIGGSSIRLWPTLRAATRLEREHGLQKLGFLLAQGSICATTAILAEHVDHVPAITVADAMRLAPDLLLHLTQLADLGEQPKGKGKPTGQPTTLVDLHRQLFGLGTGVLGWTPADTWAASPAEIVAAYDARRELLTALFGAGEQNVADAPDHPNFKADPDRRAKLKALGV